MRVWLHVPERDTVHAKRCGARRLKATGQWYVDDPEYIDCYTRWLSDDAANLYARKLEEQAMRNAQFSEAIYNIEKNMAKA